MKEERFGSYRVLSELDSGVATTVSRGAHDTLARPVAIKRLRDVVALDSAFAAAMEREAKILSELSHPNVVSLYDFVKTDRVMGLVLEHVEGVRLDAVREAAGGRLHDGEVGAIGSALADALAHAHARGVVHRDVKPGNVVLGKSGELKLLDFGAAAYVGETEARSSLPEGELAFGTPAYLAPEQLFGSEADPKADVFSLGVVLYELASGAKPFEGRAATRSPVVPIERRVPEIDRSLAMAIDAALERLPTERPTADELAARLRDVAGPLTPQTVRKLLARARLIEKPGNTTPQIALARPRRPRLLSLALPASGIALALIALTFALRRAPAKDARGPVAPIEMGELRVVAHPWAEVWVDGKLVETTPFARPLVLPAGSHRVTLRHPDAPDERREVRIGATAPVQVDVTMGIRELTSGDAGAGGG